MSLHCKFLGLLISILLLLTACSSTEERIWVEYDILSPPDSALLYEYTDNFSGATGSCAGMFTDRWYGSKLSYDQLTEILEKQLLGKGWVLWPEDVTQIWRKQSQMGLFSLSLQILTEEDTGNPQGLYKLPDSFLSEAANYPTVYVISLKYMDAFHEKHCFGK